MSEDLLALLTTSINHNLKIQNELSHSLNHLSATTKQGTELLREISEQFKNGFRAEIKNHVTKTVENHAIEERQALKDVCTHLTRVTSTSFLVKLFSVLFVSMATVAGLVALGFTL